MRQRPDQGRFFSLITGGSLGFPGAPVRISVGHQSVAQSGRAQQFAVTWFWLVCILLVI
jgi:hypothetical protein